MAYLVAGLLVLWAAMYGLSENGETIKYGPDRGATIVDLPDNHVPGKTRPPGWMPPEDEHDAFVRKIFNSPMRDPFKEPKR